MLSCMLVYVVASLADVVVGVGYVVVGAYGEVDDVGVWLRWL